MNYVNKDEALGRRLITFPENYGNIQYRTDVGNYVVNTAYGRGRDTVRIASYKKYNGGLFVLDADHFPEGKSVWPSFWLVGADWPCSGEIDIVEYANSFNYESSINHSTLHTRQSCNQEGIPGISNEGTCGAKKGGDECIPCGKWGITQDCAYVGCGLYQGYSTGGFSANRQGGGTYVTEWVLDGEIKIWYFNKHEANIFVPYYSNNVDTSGWPAPYAKFKPCYAAFRDLEIIINTTLCGDWAASDFSNKGLGNCGDFVADPSNNFADAYWLINSVRVYN